MARRPSTVTGHIFQAVRRAKARRANDTRTSRTSRPARHGCSSCGKNCHTSRGLKAHYLGGHAREVRNTRKGIPKDRRKGWVHAWGWREAAGLVDHNGRTTPRGASRPGVVPRDNRVHRVHVTHAQLRHADRHDRHHERADAREHRAEAAGRRAARTRLAVLRDLRTAKAERLRNKAARGRATAGMTRRQRRRSDPAHGGYNTIPRSHPAHPSRSAPPRPARQPKRARTRTAPVNGRSNGHAPRPLGRLAPSRPAPTGRTRT